MCCDSLGSCCLLSSLASRAHTVGQVDYTDLASVAGSCSSVSDFLTIPTSKMYMQGVACGSYMPGCCTACLVTLDHIKQLWWNMGNLSNTRNGYGILDNPPKVGDIIGLIYRFP